MRGSSENFLQHRFDLLGSGWTTVEHGMQCRGLHGFSYPKADAPVIDPDGAWLAGRINPGNLALARQIWRLVDREYVPIDWQIDFKSGYRWSEKRWYLHIPFKEGGGIDVKVPWELSRMQHLVPLAWAFALANQGSSGFREADAYAREFRNQILDFCATNPPRFGVNWRCTMDVAIRVANWILAYELFRIHGAVFDEEFERTLVSSFYDHAEYIVKHLEWFEHGRGNHYLANISGLIFAAAVLPRNSQTEGWLAFGACELVKEVEHQFHPDGTGAEASTAYHCLCAEMVTYASAVLLGLPSSLKTEIESRLKPDSTSTFTVHSPHFPRWYSERMEKMAEFVMSMSKPANTIPQIGDNDSGRFLDVLPIFEETSVADAKQTFEHLCDYTEMEDEDHYLVRNVLDRRHVVAGMNGLFRRPDFDAFSGDVRGEAELVAALAGGAILTSYRVEESMPDARRVVVGTEATRRSLLDDWGRIPPERRTLSIFPIEKNNARDKLRTYGFPHFGLFIFRTSRVYLSVRCGAMGENVIGAHAHNDQLSLELNVDGRDVVTDPGSYLYMPIPEQRNRYRSVTAHFAPQAFNLEPSRLDEHIFYLDFAHEGECIYFGPSGFVGRHRSPSFEFYRSVTLDDSEITVQDWSITHDLVSPDDFHPPEFSPGYGMRVATTNPARRR